MNNYVLVCCEESQRICSEFRALGDIAFSCDIQECSGGHPEWHIKLDCRILFRILNDGLIFFTQDNEIHHIPKWDLVIAHPPCTYLANSGKRYLNVEKYGEYAEQRLFEREKAIDFFMEFANLECDHIAIENPLGCMSERYREPDCVVQPWQFGDPVQKTTCFWTKNLPPLVPEITEKPELDEVIYISKDGSLRKRSRLFYETAFLPKEERQKTRSKTFPGIARAVARQWSAFLDSER